MKCVRCVCVDWGQRGWRVGDWMRVLDFQGEYWTCVCVWVAVMWVV